MSIGSLFAGIGGFDLAAKWMGWRTAWVSEIEPYASAVLKKHFPDAPNYGDITQIKGELVERIDILCGGFPCQDISLAGKGAGLSGARSGLWSHYARLIDEIRPRYVVAENVSALRARGLDQVLREIAALGYDAEWHCIPAYAVGAPHTRDRIWIVAYPHSERVTDSLFAVGTERSEETASAGSVASVVTGSGASCVREQDVADASRELPYGSGSPRRRGDQSPDGSEALADSIRSGLQGHAGNGTSGGRPQQDGSVTAASLCSGEYPEGWWNVEPNVGRVANGVPSRVDRLRCIGNAIVPQVAFAVFQGIAARERRLSAA